MMSYRCLAASQAGFLQQLAVAYIANGYYFYVVGVLPAHKTAARVDAKILAAYDIAISKWTRARRKQAGHANVQYLRHGRFYVIITTHGVHPFFVAEAKRLRDIRKTPILFMGYSIGCRRERGGGAYHASVRINRDTMRLLKEHFTGLATKVSVEGLCRKFHQLPFEPYAPVRGQVRGLLRLVNRLRKTAGLELVPLAVLRWHRAPVKPFEHEQNEKSVVQFPVADTTDLGEEP